MKHTTAFRYDEDEANAIQTIINYISENAPGTNPNTSDAIRYAILNSAAEIRMESNRKEVKMKFQAMVNMMDDEIRERLHNELAPCTEDEFLEVYKREHARKFGEEWEPAKENPTW